MKVFDSRKSTAERLIETYGSRAAPIAAVHVNDAVRDGRDHDLLYWDQVRRIVEASAQKVVTALDSTN